jgi:uncharacterized membrane protein
VTSTIIVMTFEDTKAGDEALKSLKHWQNEKQIELGDAAVIVKDDKGKLKFKDTEDFTTKRGAVFGGLAGVTVGFMVGGPIGGLLLGAAAGAFAGKKIDLGLPDDKIKAIGESMHNSSSAIIAEVKSGNTDLLAAAIRKSDGTLHEFTVSDDTQWDLNDALNKANLRNQ